MSEYLVDVRCVVEARDLGEAFSLVENELVEHIMNSDVITEHDYIQVRQRKDDFYE